MESATPGPSRPQRVPLGISFSRPSTSSSQYFDSQSTPQQTKPGPSRPHQLPLSRSFSRNSTSSSQYFDSQSTPQPATPGPSQPPRPQPSRISMSRSSTSSSQSLSTQSTRRVSSGQAGMQNVLQTPIGIRHNALARTATPAYSTAATPSGRRSRAASSLGGGEGHQIICAISEARGIAPSVGIAFINVSTGEAVLSQICDNQSYVKTAHKLTVFEPSRILIVSTACPPNPKSSLCSTIEEELPGIPIIPLNRKYWSETAGLEFIQTLAFREDVEAIKVAIEGNFYATCSFSAVSFLGHHAGTAHAN